MASMLTKVAERRRPWQGGAMQRLTQVINGIWPQAQVKVYGSFDTSLAIPAR